MSAVTDLELSRDQIVALIDREAMKRYKIDVVTFIAQYRDGTFDECGGAADLVALARLLPEGDPLRLGG